MSSLFVLQIKHELKKGQKSFNDKTVRMLLAQIDASDTKIHELEQQVRELKAAQPFEMKAAK
jgi:hypothetical protein